MELKAIADRISEKFAAAGHPIDRAQLEERLSRFVEEFSVPPAEAERSIISDYSRQFGMEVPGSPSRQSPDEVNRIADIEAEQWVTIVGQVVTLFPSRSPSVAQSGVIADSSGSMRFTVWAKANAPMMQQGHWYRIESAVADEYNGQISLKVHSGTTISEQPPDTMQGPEVTRIEDIVPHQWITVEGEVTTLFPPRSPSISQTGILADSSGTIRFTVWASAQAPEMQQGRWYRLDLVESDEYNGQRSIKVHAGTKITALSEEELPGMEIIPIGALKPGIVSVKGKIVVVEEPHTEFILQRGVIADESGAVRFIVRNTPGAVPLTENQTYLVRNSVVDLFRGVMSLQVSGGSATGVEEDLSIRPVLIPVAQAAPGIVSLRVKMVQEYENSSDRILQSGILGDESGTLRFVTWKNENSVRLEPETVYTIYYALVDEYNGRLSLTLNGTVCVPDETATIQVRSPHDEIHGAFVHLSPGSGLIKRCPVEGCGRVLSRQNYCPVHEIQPKFSYDLRIKGWLDTGTTTYDTIIPREGVEELIGMTLQSAQEMAENNPLGLDTVFYHISDQVLGRYLICKGRIVDNRLFAYNCAFQPFDQGMLAELINRSEGAVHE